MLRLSEKYSDIRYDKFSINTPGEKYNVENDLQRIKIQLSAYAFENDGINALAVSLPYEDLIFVRNKYLHRSNKDDEPITMGGRYDNKGNPDRDILPG